MSEVTAPMDQVAAAIYGDGAWEIVKADRTKRERRDRALTTAAAAGNAASAVAGPAALYAAVRNRKQGGIPRDIGRGLRDAGAKSSNPKLRRVGVKAGRLVSALDKPLTPKAKVAAGVAGGTMVGLQAMNFGTDALSAKLLSEKNKKVSKAVGVLKPLTPLTPKTPKMPTAAKTPKGPQKPKMPKMPEIGKSFDFTARGEISKADMDKRQVFGWASVVEINGQPVVDLQNDMATIDEIERAAYDYVLTSRKGGDMHRRDGDAVIHKSNIIESFVITPEKKAALGLPDDTPLGWWVGFKVEDDELWQLVKDGKRPQFSIHGSGKRVETSI